jgi:His/Glu/Gln/Arg/opine family amino acid ABC transporter permease subunit
MAIALPRTARVERRRSLVAAVGDSRWTVRIGATALVLLAVWKAMSTGLDWTVIPRHVTFFLQAFGQTCTLSLAAFATSFGLGLVLAMGRLAAHPVLRYPAVLVIELFRALPLLMVIFWFYFMFPALVGVNPSPYLSGVLALTVCNAAYFAEIVAAGVIAIPRGQRDAALSTGLGVLQTLRHVILPQAIRNMVPPLLSQFVYLFKSTSLVYIIGVVEFFRAATIVNNREFRSFEIFTFVAVVYFVCSWLLSSASLLLEQRLGGRTPRLYEIG